MTHLETKTHQTDNMHTIQVATNYRSYN